MKSVRHANHSLSSRHRSPQITIYGRQTDPSPEAFADKVASYLKSDFAHKVPHGSKLTLLSQMWNNQDISSMSVADMGSLWSVLQSREFTLLNLFRDSGIVPQIRGICGNFYAVEKVKYSI